MDRFYEKPQWTADAKGYDSTASLFATMAFILGGLGIIVALVLFFIAISELGNGGFGGLVGAITLAFQSIMLIVFGSMMRLQSKVILALFEIGISETRDKINQAQAD
ncbi:MAG: hypothetical protein AAGB26_16095 [Planctomycetota bacterium]